MIELKDRKYRKDSYAQSGEDMIIDFIVTNKGILKPTYLDIGAHHPFYLSNTYYFYKKGSRGVCIEPDPILFKEIKKFRPKDVCLNVGLGSKKGESEFYIIDPPTLNTFSKEEAEHLEKMGHNTLKTLRLPVVPVKDILKEYFKHPPTIVSLDVEGMDMEILDQFSLKSYRPELFCIETITYTKDRKGKKIEEIFEFMKKNKYKVYADTYVNTIFVKE